MFLIGNMRASGLTYSGEPYTGHYAGAFANGDIVGVVAHYWNGILILQAPMHLDALCRAALQISTRPLKGMIGPNEQVRAARAALHLEGHDCQMDSKEKLYSLDLDALIVPEALRTGHVIGRNAKTRDIDTLTHWRVEYDIAVLGDEETDVLWEEERAAAEHVIEAGNTWILEDQGTPVATSAFNSSIDEAVQIGGVWTPPEFRSRGYARGVVAQSLLDAREDGVEKAILFTDEDNIPAQKAYTALGFHCIGDYHILILREPLTITI
jgi:RimJ/RimL family protein N-acetyltransferase